ncbi:MAG: thioredoxin-disulfide reductase [Deltaproteobacteria bacterium]
MSQIHLPEYDYDIVIVGGGPAGYTAGIYAARAALRTLLVEGAGTVSQITITDMIENYPGIPDGIGGFELMQLFKKQALKFGLEIAAQDVTAVRQASADPVLWEVAAGDRTYRALSVIVATGAMWRSLGVPGEAEFAGRGVSYCATCDGPFYRNRTVVVVGGGDTAIQEALFLTHFADRVIVIHRRDRLRAAGLLQNRAFAEKKIAFVWNATVEAITGAEFVTGVRVKDVKTGAVSEIAADGAFIFVGRLPYTEVFQGLVAMDKTGFIVTDENLRTDAPGIFAAGDCRAKQFRQVVTAAGDGANAANSAELYIDELKGRTY